MNSTERGAGKKVAFKCVKSVTGNEVSLFGSLQAYWKCLNPRTLAFQ